MKVCGEALWTVSSIKDHSPNREPPLNTPEDIRRYREEQREDLLQSVLTLTQWLSQTILIPALLALILWRMW